MQVQSDATEIGWLNSLQTPSIVAELRALGSALASGDNSGVDGFESVDNGGDATKKVNWRGFHA